MNHQTAMPARIPAFLLAFTIVATLAGCGSSPETPTDENRAPADAPAAFKGLRLSSWTIDDRTATTGKGPTPAELAFARIESHAQRPVPLGAGAVDAWRREGVRVVAIPRSEADSLRAELKLAGPLQQQFFGEVLRWTTIHAGAESEFALLLDQPGGPLRLNAGELRLLARAFAIPGAPTDDGGVRAAMRLDLAVQHFDPTIVRPDSVDLSATRRPNIEEQGTILRSLSTSAVLDGTDVLVILTQPREAEELTEPNETQGPLPATLPRVGDALLTDYSSLPKPHVRTILMLDPIVPTKYELPAF